jgi:hypothetical protein
MGQRRIAYTAGESLLLTVDRGSVIAYEVVDGSVKWTFSVEKQVAMVSVVYASTSALPSDLAAGPWRSPSSASTAVALDSEGVLHALDAVLGRELGTVKHEGEPVTLAGAGDALAVAFTDRVILYRAGAKHEIAKKATALAFSRDGLTLAIGTAKGELFFVDIGTRAVTAFEPAIGGNISDVSPRPGGGWLVSSERGLTAVYSKKSEKQLNGLVTGAVVDSLGKRLAVHRSEANVVLYAWPPTVPVGRISATGGTIRDIAFGPDDKLGVAMAGGGGAMIDPMTYAVVRTAQRPDEPRAVWLVSAESEEARAARTAEQTRRAQAHEPKSGMGARLGIGGLISLALLVIRIFLIGARASTPSWTPPTDFGKIPKYSACDHACETSRLEALKQQCELTTKIDCKSQAQLAAGWFEQGDCDMARQALATIDRMNKDAPGGGDALVSAEQLLATLGLDTACREVAKKAKAYALIRLAGSALGPTEDGGGPLGELALEGDAEHAIWASPDGVLFVATRSHEQKCALHRHVKSDASWTLDLQNEYCSAVGLFGRSSREVYLNLGNGVRRFDGKSWDAKLETPMTIGSIAGTTAAGADVFALTEAGQKRTLFQINGRTFGDLKVASMEPAPEELFGGTAMWAYGANDEANDLLFRWNGSGWAKRGAVSDAGDPDFRSFHALWQSPGGHVFIAKGDNVSRSTNDGVTWTDTELPFFADQIWGRSNTDVYVGGLRGLMRFDGKSWTHTNAERPVYALTGDAKDLYVLTR